MTEGKNTVSDVSEEVKKATDPAVANLMKLEPKVWRDLMGEQNDETPEEIAELIVNSVNTHPLMLTLNHTMEFLRFIANQVMVFNQKLGVVVGAMEGEENEGAVPNDIPELNQLDVNDLEGIRDTIMLRNDETGKRYLDMKVTQAEELAVAILSSSATDPLTAELYLGYAKLRYIVDEIKVANIQLDKIIGRYKCV